MKKIFNKIKNIFNFEKNTDINENDKEKKNIEKAEKLTEKIHQNFKEIKRTEEEENKKLIEIDNLQPLKKFEEIDSISIQESNLDPNKLTIMIADDHPGSIRLMKNDIETILKDPDFNFELNDSVKTRIYNLNEKYGKIDKYNILKFSTNYAPYIFQKTCEKYSLKIDLAILDIIYGGIVAKEGKKYTQDGIDIAEYILSKNNKSVIIFYTGCDIEESSHEYNRIRKLQDNFPERVLVTDKDINDNKRLNIIINGLIKINELNEKEEL